jgi:putative transposase
VWAADITDIALPAGWAYLVAILEWFSRYVLAWELSVIRNGAFCVEAWHQAVARAGRAPEIMNTDQGAEFRGGNSRKLLT